ncbi:hypothetical protein SCP_0705060 [Sparassis crispa]|uniref:Uncharacterized protein n=1 Tax=Sparassis crispa TaxID=139825 RepID=A0A401GT25_9APHY|nr:hypothetical protein SCP_0705060 [Sparassis crispa]GBE85319.1 hypothetical protein SCP_0705060 [Sparassis crispa]
MIAVAAVLVYFLHSPDTSMDQNGIGDKTKLNYQRFFHAYKKLLITASNQGRVKELIKFYNDVIFNDTRESNTGTLEEDNFIAAMEGAALAFDSDGLEDVDMWLQEIALDDEHGVHVDEQPIAGPSRHLDVLNVPALQADNLECNPRVIPSVAAALSDDIAADPKPANHRNTSKRGTRSAGGGSSSGVTANSRATRS